MVPLTRELYEAVIDSYQTLPHCETQTIGTIRCTELGTLPLSFVHYAPRSRKRRLKVLITAGIHGDESAPVFALQQFIQETAFEEREDIEIFAFPCVNPSGFIRGTRFSSQGFDLNRQIDPLAISAEVRHLLSTISQINQSFDVVFDLHEDNPAVPCDFATVAENANGFYLYEGAHIPECHSRGASIVEAVRLLGLPIATDPHVYGELARDGVVFRDRRACSRKDFERYMLMKWTSRIFIPETLTTWNFSDRLAAHVSVLHAGLCSIQHQCRR